MTGDECSQHKYNGRVWVWRIWSAPLKGARCSRAPVSSANTDGRADVCISPTCLANDRSALMATADRENCFEDWIASPAYWAALATCRTATERHLCQTVCKATTAAVFLFFLDRINYVELSRNEWKCRVSVRFADDGLFMCTSHMNKLYRIVLSMEYKGWSNTDHLTWTTSTVSRNSMLFLKKMSIYFYFIFFSWQE